MSAEAAPNVSRDKYHETIPVPPLPAPIFTMSSASVVDLQVSVS